MANMETATFDTELSLFKYDNLEQLPASHRDLTEAEREPRIDAALDELGDSVVILGHNYQQREIVEHASHPYTRALLNSTPNLDAPLEEMQPIEGSSPAPINLPGGCAYHPRCPLATEECRTTTPEFERTADGHVAACHHTDEADDRIPLNYEELLEADTLGPDGGRA